jgi:RNA polymerase sigma-70 factor (ECF subfamily)
MATVILRRKYKDKKTGEVKEITCPIEVLDCDVDAFQAVMSSAVADVYFTAQCAEKAYRRRMYRHRAHYSINRSDGIEEEAFYEPDTPFTEYLKKLSAQQLHTAIAELPDKQAKRIYAHFFLGMSKTDIAVAEGVNEKAVRLAIEGGLRNLEKLLKKYF